MLCVLRKSLQAHYIKTSKLLHRISGIVAVGAVSGIYCALVLAELIPVAAAISATLATAGLAIAALLILAGVIALMMSFNEQTHAPIACA